MNSSQKEVLAMNLAYESLTECRRCGSMSLEHLATYCHCPECLYSPDLERCETPRLAVIQLPNEPTTQAAPQAEELIRANRERVANLRASYGAGW